MTMSLVQVEDTVTKIMRLSRLEIMWLHVFRAQLDWPNLEPILSKVANNEVLTWPEQEVLSSLECSTSFLEFWEEIYKALFLTTLNGLVRGQAVMRQISATCQITYTTWTNTGTLRGVIVEPEGDIPRMMMFPEYVDGKFRHGTSSWDSKWVGKQNWFRRYHDQYDVPEYQPLYEELHEKYLNAAFNTPHLGA